LVWTALNCLGHPDRKVVLAALKAMPSLVLSLRRMTAHVQFVGRADEPNQQGLLFSRVHLYIYIYLFICHESLPAIEFILHYHHWFCR
jgi:hypothetical protein